MTLPGQSGVEPQPQYAAAAERRLVDHPSALANLAHEFARSRGQTVAECREEYDDACIGFAGDCADGIPGARLAYFETLNNPRWRYHAAVELNGFIHDLWGPERAMPIEKYLTFIGATAVEYPAEETA